MSFCLNKTIEQELRAIPGNSVCCDCDAKGPPQWASVSFGVFMCLECSGRHRALGVHISFVRSVSMDSWNDKQVCFLFFGIQFKLKSVFFFINFQITMMRKGGNEQCNLFLAQYNVSKNMIIPQKYNTPAALLYKDR